jgi:hypothetical protein
MPKMVVIHDVADTDKWLEFKDERASAIGMVGGTNVVDHVAQDGANTVAVSADVSDMDGMMAALSSPPPEMLEIMQRHGVIPPLTIYVER